jgi:peptidoglycan/LPS O-acetylase OafA/YrhL
MANASAQDGKHLAVLDGWRGISILLVLAGHLLPLGPGRWRLNETAGPMGMAIFFTLSGFLITRFLWVRPDVRNFLIRRLFRIVPIAWLGMTVVLLMAQAPPATWLAHFGFYANLPPVRLTDPGAHLWSLCVEVQFYLGVALVVSLVGRKGLFVLPLACVAVTAGRIWNGAEIGIVTWFRIDEILAGCIVALSFEGALGARPRRLLRWLSPFPLLVLLAASGHPDSGWLNYLRPYLAAALVGSTLVDPPPALARLLGGRALGYIAAISYALYVIHHPLIYTWLGSGDRLEKYLKRPLLIGATFLLAHVSTFHFEKPLIAVGKRLAEGRPRFA